MNLGDILKRVVGAVVAPVASLFPGHTVLGSWGRSQIGSGLTGAQMEANQFSHQEAQLAYERTLQADSFKHQREVADLQAAGLNPMLATGMSGGSIQSSPASGVSPSSPGMNLGDLLGAALRSRELGIQSKVADSEVAVNEAREDELLASAAEKRSRTVGQDIQNWIQDKTKELQVESARLENDYKEGKIRVTDEQVNEVREKVKLLVKQQDTEAARAGALLAQEVLSHAQASQIIELLPYQKALMSAQTENQKAAAALAWAHEAYQRGLIDNGYLDSFCRQAVASADKLESESTIAGVKAAIQSGDYSHSGIGYVPVISEAVTGIANAFGVIGNVFSGVLK